MPEAFSLVFLFVQKTTFVSAEWSRNLPRGAPGHTAIPGEDQCTGVHFQVKDNVVNISSEEQSGGQPRNIHTCIVLYEAWPRNLSRCIRCARWQFGFQFCVGVVWDSEWGPSSGVVKMRLSSPHVAVHMLGGYVVQMWLSIPAIFAFVLQDVQTLVRINHGLLMFPCLMSCGLFAFLCTYCQHL